MPIQSLQITDFRNITHCTLVCAPTFNVFYGDNAAGKTSVLESIYYLSTGKSFRTSQLDTLIRHNANYFSLFLLLTDNGIDVPVGVSRDLNGIRKIRMNESNVATIASISNLLPMQFIGTHSHRILLDGPMPRRQFLDWGIFHTQPTFYDQWKAFQKLLTQRNAALKAQISKSELSTWNDAFVIASEQLNQFRTDYINSFSPTFKRIVHHFLHTDDINISYSSGWSADIALSTLLSQSVFKEYKAGYSLYGPHRADFQININQHPAQHVLSQGQQKLLSYALRLAQGIHLQTMTAKSPIYLIDDLPSELDPQKRRLVFQTLSDINAQVFITGIELEQLSDFLSTDEIQLFHVKQGCIDVSRETSRHLITMP